MRTLVFLFIIVNIYLTYGFEKVTFTINDKNIYIFDFDILNSEYYISGMSNNKDKNNTLNANSIFVHFNQKIKRDIELAYQRRSIIRSFTLDSNKNIYLLNTILNGNQSNEDVEILKINSKNEISSSYFFGTYNSDDEFQKIKYTKNNLFLFGPTSNSSLIVKLDTNLNEVWSKEYQFENVYFLESFYFDEDRIIVVGWDRYNRSNNNYTLIMSIDYDGNIINKKIYEFLIPNYEVRNSPNIIKVKNDYLFYLRRFQNTNIDPYLIKIDKDLEIKSTSKLIMDEFKIEPVLAENDLNYFIISSDDNVSYIHSFNKDDDSYNKSYYIKNMEKYRIENLKIENNILKIFGVSNNYENFLMKDDLNKLCQLNDTILNLKITEPISYQLISQDCNVKDYNNETKHSYIQNNIPNLTFDYTTCSTPCGDGSEFDSKVSSLDKFELNGAKLTEIDSYLMTDEKDYFSYGALSHIEPVYVSAGFNSEFAFRIDKGYNDFIDGSLPGADGFSLIFHTDNHHLNFKSDQYGGGMGFHNRKNAVALEIDLYNNDEYSDPDGNHIAFQVPKDGILEAIHSDENTLGINSNIPIMKADGQETYYCKLEYKDNILKVWINNSQDYGNPTLDIPNFKFSDYLSLIEHSKVYVTLAAVTGTSYQKQEVIFWDWCSYYDPISSIEDNTKKDIIGIYPNPSSDMIYIDGINYQENIELFDLTGRLILQQNYNNGINISDLNRGIYILNIQNQNYKIIKE